MPQPTNRHLSWLADTSLASGRQSPWRRVLGACYGVPRAAAENFLANDDLLRASALTYTVALSIVPILALAFSALKGFGAFNPLKPVIERYIAFGSPQVSDQLMSYVERTNATAVGSAGAAFLLFTVISTMSNVEAAFNDIWRVPRSRSNLRKFSDYLSVLFTVPLLMVAALTMTTVLAVRIGELGLLAELTPYLMTWAGFFFLYVFFPYTHVEYGAALAGSLASAIMFQIGQWAYVKFQIGVANYQAIYGALATLPIFLVWIYIAWSIVLFGAEISAAIQRGAGRHMLPRDAPEFPYMAALYILLRLADEHRKGAHPARLSMLASELGVDEKMLEPVVARLHKLNFVIDAGEPKAKGHGLVLGRLPSEIRLAAAVGAIDAGRAEVSGDSRIRAFLDRMNEAHAGLLESTTLADLMNNRFAAAGPANPPASAPVQSEI